MAEPIELLTPAEMARADAITIEGGVCGIALMEVAGVAVAAAARRRWSGGSIVVLCGPGNNGGDGWVAARLLREAGYRVSVALYGDRNSIRGDASQVADRFAGVVVPAGAGAFRNAGLIIDALFGVGVRLPLADDVIQLIDAVNESTATIVSVDLPSGVEGGSGSVSGSAVQADETVSFFRLKPGHILLPGRLCSGTVTLADIGIGQDTLAEIAPKTWLNRPVLWQPAFPRPRVDGHKHNRGHVLVVSGSAWATGAARLAASGALRIGAGLVSVASPEEALSDNAAHLTSIMLKRMDGAEGLRRLLADKRLNTVVLGPGLGVGEESQRLTETAVRTGRTVILDADALTSFAEEPNRLFGAIARSGARVVLTPHDGEFARLFPDLGQSSRLDRAKSAAERSRATVLLKGPDTVVAQPDGRAAIADNAPPDLATAGAGDVLAGLVGGLAAQGMPNFEAAVAAVWIHGAAAGYLGPGLVAEDLEGAVVAVLRGLAWPVR